MIELYTYLLATYLPKRFPDMFKLHFTSFNTGSQFMFENTLTKEIYPTVPTQATSTQNLLRTLGNVIDEDFLFLLPEDDGDDPKYILEALVCVCPSGWDPKEKIGKRLASIHTPVPGYKDKLEGSMDRYFKSLEVGKYVKRSNWAISQHEELFLPDSNTNHGVEGEEIVQLTEIDPDKVGDYRIHRRHMLIRVITDLLEDRETDSTSTTKVKGYRLCVQNLSRLASRCQA